MTDEKLIPSVWDIPTPNPIPTGDEPSEPSPDPYATMPLRSRRRPDPMELRVQLVAEVPTTRPELIEYRRTLREQIREQRTLLARMQGKKRFTSEEGLQLKALLDKDDLARRRLATLNDKRPK